VCLSGLFGPVWLIGGGDDDDDDDDDDEDAVCGSR
jgi:hypothetical protein